MIEVSVRNEYDLIVSCIKNLMFCENIYIIYYYRLSIASKNIISNKHIYMIVIGMYMY